MDLWPPLRLEVLSWYFPLSTLGNFCKNTVFQVNTLLALISGAVFAYVFSGLANHDRFLMFDIARSTIAGGVAISSIANMLVSPHVAMIIGVVRMNLQNLLFQLSISNGLGGSAGLWHGKSIRAK
jgi:hypothetical protein